MVDPIRALLAEMAAELDHNRRCLLDDTSVTHSLADRARAALAEPVAEPPPPPPAPPLWRMMHEEWREVMYEEWRDTGAVPSDATGYAAEIDAVADWLDARAVGVDAVAALRAEAQRAREGA